MGVDWLCVVNVVEFDGGVDFVRGVVGEGCVG